MPEPLLQTCQNLCILHKLCESYVLGKLRASLSIKLNSLFSPRFSLSEKWGTNSSFQGSKELMNVRRPSTVSIRVLCNCRLPLCPGNQRVPEAWGSHVCTWPHFAVRPRTLFSGLRGSVSWLFVIILNRIQEKAMSGPDICDKSARVFTGKISPKFTVSYISCFSSSYSPARKISCLNWKKTAR